MFIGFQRSYLLLKFYSFSFIELIYSHNWFNKYLK